MSEDNAQVIDLIKSIHLFRHLKDPQIDLIADNLSWAKFEQGQRIYKQGDRADNLYIIFKGSVRVSYWEQREETRLGVLENGKVFGYEVVVEGQDRLTTIYAAEATTLIYFTPEKLKTLQAEIHGLAAGLHRMWGSLQLSLQVPTNWRNPEEAILFISRRHPYALVVRLLPIVLPLVIFLPILFYWFLVSSPPSTLPLWLAGILFFILFPWILWKYIDWSNDYSIITTQRVLFQEKIILLYNSRQEAPLNAILSVKLDTTQWGRWLAYGDVIVQTYAFNIILSQLLYPNMVIALMDEMLGRTRTSQNRTQRQAVENQLRQRIGYRKIGDETDKGETAPEEEGLTPSIQVQEGSLQHLLVNLFQMRWEKDGQITYRTHWYILFKRIWLPTLIILLVFIFWVLQLITHFIPLPQGPFLLLLLPVFLCLFGWWLYQYVDWRNDYYIITDDLIIDVYKKPLGREERREAPVRNIQSIQFSRLGIIGLVLNFGTVSIRVGEDQLTFDDVYNPSEVQHELFKRVAQREQRQRQRDNEAEQQQIADYIEIYHELQEENRDQNSPPKPPQTG